MEESEFYCYICSIGFSSLVFLKEHNLSLMHHKVLDHQMKNNGSRHPDHHCFVCNKSMHLISWLKHIESTRHQNLLERMKASMAHNGSWPEQQQQQQPPPSRSKPAPRSQNRPNSHPKSHHKFHQNSFSNSHPNSRPNMAAHMGNPESMEFQAAAWKAPQPPPSRPDHRLPQRAFSPADSDESERRRQRDRAETEALLRKAQAMQETFRRDRERQASRERQRDLYPGMEGPIQGVGRAGQGDVNVRPGKDSTPEISRTIPVTSIKGNTDFPKNESMMTSFSRMTSASKSPSFVASVSSVSLPLRDSPTPASGVNNSRLTSAPEAFKGHSKRSSAEILSKLAGPSALLSRDDQHRPGSSSALLNVINSPRGRKERRQLADLLRTLPNPAGPPRRPRLNPSLSPAALHSIAQHEAGAAKLPMIDFSGEEATSGVTSLSTTAREEQSSDQLSSDTARSVLSLVSPAAKKRKTAVMEDVPVTDESSHSEEPLSEEVSRMQLALQLSVQQQAVHRKVELLNNDLSDQYRQLEALQRKIEGMEIELSKLRGQESEIHQQRMDVLKRRHPTESYMKPFVAKSSEASVTSASECSTSRVESSLSTSAAFDHSVTSSDSHTDTVIAARPVVVKQEVEVIDSTDDTEEPLIGNLTAREIRERAMAMIGSGAMNFADLDDVLSELMDKVSADNTEELDAGHETDPDPVPLLVPATPEEQRSSKKKRRLSKTRDSDRDSLSESRAESDSVVSDVMSARPGVGASSKNGAERSGRKSANSSHSEESSLDMAGVPVPTFAGVIEAHNGPVHDLQLFRNCLYSCAEDAMVKKFNPQTHECMKHFSGFSDSVRCLLVTEKPKGVPRIFSGGDEKVLLVHDARTGEEQQRLSLDSQVTCMQLHWFSLFVGLSSGTVLDLDVRKNSVQHTKRISDHPVRLLQTARKDGRTVMIVATSNGTLWVLDSSLKNTPKQILPPSQAGEHPMQLQSARDWLFFVTNAGRLRQLCLSSSKHFAEDVPAEFNAKVCCLHVTSDSQHLLVGCRDGSIRQLDLMDLTQVTKVHYTPCRFALTAITSHLNGKTGSIFAGNKHGQLFIIHVSNTTISCEFGDCKATFGSRDDLVYHVTREHVMSASESDVPCLWAKTCKHRFDRTRSEDISIHVRLHV